MFSNVWQDLDQPRTQQSGRTCNQCVIGIMEGVVLCLINHRMWLDSDVRGVSMGRCFEKLYQERDCN